MTESDAMTIIIHAAEWLAAITAIAGTLLLAGKGPRAGLGWPLYLVSNVCWIGAAMHHSAWALLAQQVVFLGITIFGIWAWLVKPMLEDPET